MSRTSSDRVLGRRRIPAVPALVIGGCLLMAMGTTRAEDFGTDIANAFKQGTINVGFRYRYEFVEDDNPGITEDAYASTLRSRLTYQTAEFRNFSLLLEMDDLRSIGDADYNDTRNGKTNRPIVADPEATDFNQGAIRYMGLEGTEVIVGRQRILRGNERFIGPVGWRQNEQTFDAASVNYKFGDKLQAYYAYVSQANRVFGPDSGTPPEDFSGNTHLADLTYTFGPYAKLTAYGYFLDLEEAPLSSSQTLGLRLAGDIRINDQLSIPYAAEYATQDEYGNYEDVKSDGYSADYYVGEVGVKWQKVLVKLVYEVLEGSTTANEAFQTPLATLHAFQGWADKFLTTPTGGIENAYLLVDFPLFGGNVRLRYDDFQAETGSLDYGDEMGAWATWPIGKFYSVGVKYATFNADSESTAATLQDTDKFWVILSASF
jgi:hypothetical protein